MTFYVTRPLRAHALSAAVGSGKTRAAVRWMTSRANAARNFLYIAPTIDLGAETTVNIDRALAEAEGPDCRNAHLLNSRNAQGKTRAEALRIVNEVRGEEGHIQVLTTQTFLDILSGITRPDLWTVILDEAFAPATFETFGLGADVQEGWAYFSDVFDVDATSGHRIVPKSGRKTLVADLADGRLNKAGGKYEGLQKVARAVANPASRCELVVTPRVAALMSGAALPARKKEGAESVLEFASYIAPEYFRDFREVLFLSALFEQTVLYKLWTKALGVTFEQHPEFPVEMLRDTHAEQGRYLAIGHLLHADDTSSKENLGRNLLTGETGEKHLGERVLDHIIKTASVHFDGQEFLLQTNNASGYKEGAALVPCNARLIPAYAHGLNKFQGIDNVVALCVTNPNPQQLAWVRERTGMSSREVTQSFRIHTAYQALGRCSIRRAEATTSLKTVLVAGIDDAKFLLALFSGAHWVGQVGRLPSLRSLAASNEEKTPGKVEALSEAILQYLGKLDVDRIGSKTLKAALQLTKDTLQLKVQKVIWPVAPQTWSRAVELACAPGTGWTKQAGSLVRVSAAAYGFQEQMVAASQAAS